MQAALNFEEDFNLFDHLASISQEASNSMSSAQKAKFAAYYTPKALSEHMVNISDYRGGVLGDNGAGAGILSAMSAVKHILSPSKTPCDIQAYEIQQSIQPFLQRAYGCVKQQANAAKKAFDFSIKEDFLADTHRILSREFGAHDTTIINPPYFKISPKTHPANQIVKKKLGFTLPNIYSLFILLSLHQLKANGSLTALVPRSFFNGQYHAPFRAHIRAHFNIDSITRYRSRSNDFNGDNVLQENVIVRFTRQPQQARVSIFTFDTPLSNKASTMVLPASLIMDNDEGYFALPADEEELNAYERVKSQTLKLADFGVTMSTGKVVPFRSKDDLNHEHEGSLYLAAKSIDTNGSYCKINHNHRTRGNALRTSDASNKLVLPAQNLILIKRISSNSDTKRMHAAILKKEDISTESIALDNSLQYICGDELKDLSFAEKLLSYLTSNDLDLAMRAINGTTQINVSDIEAMRFPKLI